MKKLYFSLKHMAFLYSLQLALMVSVFLISSAAHAQQPLSMKKVPYSWKYTEQGDKDPAILRQESAHILEVPGATWLRLYFENVNLGKDSYVKLTSLKDGASQILDAQKMAQWNYSSAYFNGDQVKIEVFSSRGDRNISVSIKEVDAGEPEVTISSQCGPTDDRVPSNDAAVGRIVPVGCTGWIIKNGKMVTAGHCNGSGMQVLQFNVPQSNSDGSIVHPSPSDQYTITNVVEGSLDWAVFETLPNSQTGLTAIDAQGKSFDVKQVNSAVTIRITGFGVDSGSRNQTQQTHSGPYSSSTSSKIYYTVDTEGGNSGSPVIDEGTGHAIGVHTHGGCSSSGGTNSGTNARVAAFWDAMGLDATDPDPCSTTISAFPYNQSFETGIGAWTQYSNDNLDWTRDSGGTPSSGTGPASAIDGSYYLYIEASGSDVGYPNKKAIIGMPCFDVTTLTQPVLTFSYHMEGTSMGTLVVETSTDGGNSWSAAWSASGNQGSAWKNASVNLPSATGLSIRFNGTTGSSWSSDIAIDQVSVKEAGADPNCETINFNAVTFSSYSVADDGNYTVLDDATVLLEDNTWRSISFNYTVTANTVLEFEFRSTSQGEIHGIGFDTDATAASGATFKVHGTQNWGITNFDNYSGSDWVSYSIPVGDFYTGTFSRLFFSNDNDGGSGNNSYFRNVIVHEGGCSTTASTATLARSSSGYVPEIGNEGMEHMTAVGMDIFPNPVSDIIHVNFGKAEGLWELKITGFEGKEFFHTSGSVGEGQITANVSNLPAGVYLVSLETEKGKVHRKIIKQ